MAAVTQLKISLKDYLNEHCPDLEAKLEIFIALAEQIASVHNQGVIHNAIHPGAFWVVAETGTVTIDAAESCLPCNASIQLTESPIQGPFSYIAPEQTGRTAHAIDFRSDYYSLGVVLYEALTGKAPFDGANLLEAFHAHMAIVPAPVHTLNPAIPLMLSDIVSKLLAKHPEDRYQSMAGLIADLSTCLEHFRANGEIPAFAIAAKDSSPRFDIPQKLYGRHREIKMVMDEYQRIQSGNVGILLFNGPPGIGKSFLINESLSLLMKEGASVYVGKFDPYENAVPYSAISQALTGWVRHTLTLDHKVFEQQRQKMLSAVGENGRLMVELIPALELVIGRQPALDPPSPQEMLNRFRYAFKRLFRSIADAAHPVVFFIDDLQWADAASVQLLESALLDFELSHLLFIGAYRDIEAEENSILRQFLNTLREKLPQAKCVALPPIDNDDVGMLLADMLHEDPAYDDRLPRLIMTKTNGNPLFIKEFLIHLHNGGLIRCRQEECAPHMNRWCIDVEGSAKTHLPDTIVALLTTRIGKLPDADQNLLKTAACIGLEFTAERIARINDQPLDEITRVFERLRDKGLIRRTPNGFQFIHDRVKETVYDLNTEQQRVAVHYAIGKILMTAEKEADSDEDVFGIAFQLNAARAVLNDKERNALIALNLKAGQKAKQITAYAAAMNYFNSSLALLEENHWQTHYELALTIHTEAAETAFFCADCERSRQLVDTILQKARNLLDKIPAYEVRIRTLYVQNKPLDAAREAKQVLRLLGLKFPWTPNKRQLLWQFILASWSLRRRTIKGLYDLTEASGPVELCIDRILKCSSHAAITTDPNLFVYLIIEGIRRSLHYGITPGTYGAYATYGAIVCNRTPAIEAGYRLGQLAVTLAERSRLKSSIVMPQVLVNAWIIHWKQDVRMALKPLLEAHKTALETGKIEFACIAIAHYFDILICIGEPLEGVSQQLTYYRKTLRQFGEIPILAWLNVMHQFVHNLMGVAVSPKHLQGDTYDEDKMRSIHIAAGDELMLGIVNGYRVVLNYLFGGCHEAIQAAEEFTKHFRNIPIMIIGSAVINMYESLARLDLLGSYPAAPEPKEKRTHLKKVAANQRKLKHWARHAPMNILNKWTLVEAERARIRKKDFQAKEYYYQAIELSRNNGFHHEESLSHYLTAKYFLSRHDPESAKRHFQECFNISQKMGSVAICRRLETEHAAFFPKREQNQNKKTVHPSSRLPSKHATMTASDLDIKLLTAAMDATSNPIDAKGQLHNVCASVMKYSGASRGVLLLHREGHIVIGLDHRIGEKPIGPILHRPANGHCFPETIINYVMRTEEPLVLDNARKTNFFAADRYIKDHRVGSILCLPLMGDRCVTALLYLENDLNGGVFQPQHVKMIKGLCGQIPLLIENDSLKASQTSSKKPIATPALLMLSLQRHYGLTPQEAKVASLLKEGRNRSQVCEALDISYGTLKRHLLQIYDKALNTEEEEFSGEGRIDKLSRLILFLFKHSELLAASASAKIGQPGGISDPMIEFDAFGTVNPTKP